MMHVVTMDTAGCGISNFETWLPVHHAIRMFTQVEHPGPLYVTQTPARASMLLHSFTKKFSPINQVF